MLKNFGFFGFFWFSRWFCYALGKDPSVFLVFSGFPNGFATIVYSANGVHSAHGACVVDMVCIVYTMYVMRIVNI